MLRVLIIVGTRPELIKLGPLIHEIRKIPEYFKVTVLSTGQHPGLNTVLNTQDNRLIDLFLEPIVAHGSLNILLSMLVSAINVQLDIHRPDILVVQGDTASSLAGAIAAANSQIPVAHVEAGLRTGNPQAPFPEEMNRKIISQIASLHFAPTMSARTNLLREGIALDTIAVTGNTAVDALDAHFKPLSGPISSPPIPTCTNRDEQAIVVTCHRRESWAGSLKNICLAVSDVAALAPDAIVLFILPGNTALHAGITAILGQQPRIKLIPALPYIPFLRLLSRARLVLTDSGGIQEEAPSLGTPTVIMRNETDRPEISGVPGIRLAGTTRAEIVRHARELLALKRRHPRSYGHATNPFGDGYAAPRIVQAMNRWHKGIRPLLDPEQEFGARPAAGGDDVCHPVQFIR